MAFHEVQFPTNISYGSEGGPGFNTNVIETDSGAEQRVARWANPRHTYEAGYTVRTQTDLAAVKEFYVARQGALNGFRFKDWLDFTTNADGFGSTTHNDCQIGIGDGSETQFQLVKTYVSGAITRTRKITKPVSGTVAIGIDTVDQGSGWSVNLTTGIVTFDTAPANLEVITWGGEFDVPVRFGESADRALAATIEHFEEGSIPNIPLVELIDELPIEEEFYYGGAAELALTADATITPGNGRFIHITPSADAYKLILPDETAYPMGGPYFYLYNENGSAYTVLVRKADDTALVTISANDGVEIFLGLDGSGNRMWYAV
jgi:uncharacterized protein (TIGR02217 family)